MIHDGKANMDWEKLQQWIEWTNIYGLLNDHIRPLFSKVLILVIFCWIDNFFP
jgi:hypothetical protein